MSSSSAPDTRSHNLEDLSEMGRSHSAFGSFVHSSHVALAAFVVTLALSSLSAFPAYGQNPFEFFGHSPPVPDSVAELIISADPQNNRIFAWASNDSILGIIATGNIVARSWQFISGEGTDSPPRVVFTGVAEGAMFYGDVLLGDYHRAVVDVVKAGKRIRYLLEFPATNCDCTVCQLSGNVLAQGPVDRQLAEFVNSTRGRDKVVSAKDDALGLPGGEKVLSLKFDSAQIPAGGAMLKLKIRRKAGDEGSAVFKNTLTDELDVTTAKGEPVAMTILGRNVSDTAHNMVIDATKDGRTICSFEFTVFRVDPTSFVEGDVRDVLPITATNFKGQKLLDLFIRGTFGSVNLGHESTKNILAYGGIVIKGKIVPTGMKADDFNLKHSRSEAFNWDRRISSRELTTGGCFVFPIDPTGFFAAAKDNASDDETDDDEDLQPERDGTVGDLFIWTFDTPIVSNDRTPNDGDIVRVRKQFTEQAQYAGIKVSRDILWYWRTSQENPPGIDDVFVEDNTIRGDNELKADATTPLTADLAATRIPAGFNVTGSTPPTARRGQFPIAGGVTGALLNSLAPCQPLVYMINELPSPVGLTRTVIKLTIANVTGATVAGTYSIPGNAPLGSYLVKVFISDQARTSPNKTSITP